MLKTVNQFILINAILSIAFYFTYVLDQTTIARAGTEFLYITVIPFTLLVFRLLLLNNLPVKDDDPINFIEKDKALKGLFFVYLIVLVTVLFL